MLPPSDARLVATSLIGLIGSQSKRTHTPNLNSFQIQDVIVTDVVNFLIMAIDILDGKQ